MSKGYNKKFPQNPIRFVLGYVFTHMRRSFLKSLLTIAVAALMLMAITQFAQMKLIYSDMRINMVIEPTFIDSCTLYNLNMLQFDGFAQDVYYEETLQSDVHYGYDYSEKHVAITNDIGRYTNEEFQITYAPGYDENSLTKFDNIIFVGESILEKCNFELGDIIKLSPKDKMRDVMIPYKAQFITDFPTENPSTENIRKAYGELLETTIDNFCTKLKIAGVITTPSGAYDDTLFMPGVLDPLDTFGTGILLDLAQFKLSDNELVSQMRDRGNEIVYGSSGSFIMDTAKLDSAISTSALLDNLYPIAVAVAVIIGGFLCILVIMQTRKEAAIMRIQGTTRIKTLVILSVEQIILSVVGIIVGIAVMTIIKGADISMITMSMSMFAALYLSVIIISSIVSSAIVTSKNILQLLQSKE